MTQFKEPFYKGGRVRERVPSWTDRIQYHSLADRSGELLPELLDPSAPETSAHNYHAVNDGLDTSDHSPVFATFTLQVRAHPRPGPCPGPTPPSLRLPPGLGGGGSPSERHAGRVP